MYMYTKLLKNYLPPLVAGMAFGYQLNNWQTKRQKLTVDSNKLNYMEFDNIAHCAFLTSIFDKMTQKPYRLKMPWGKEEMISHDRLALAYIGDQWPDDLFNYFQPKLTLLAENSTIVIYSAYEINLLAIYIAWHFPKLNIIYCDPDQNSLDMMKSLCGEQLPNLKLTCCCHNQWKKQLNDESIALAIVQGPWSQWNKKVTPPEKSNASFAFFAPPKQHRSMYNHIQYFIDRGVPVSQTSHQKILGRMTKNIQDNNPDIDITVEAVAPSEVMKMENNQNCIIHYQPPLIINNHELSAREAMSI